MEPVVIIALLGICVNITVGIILVRQIKAQSTMLQQYRDLISAMDPTKIKQANELIEQGIEMKHKMWAAKELNAMSDVMQKQLLTMNEHVRDEYNEMFVFILSVLQAQPPVPRETLLTKRLPHSSKELRKHLESGRSTDQVQDSSPTT